MKKQRRRHILLENANRVTEEVWVQAGLERKAEMETVFLAGGCFWGVQKFFDQFAGVLETEAGYANGPDRQPTYQEVCADSGHAETVRVVYDPERISLETLLTYYFMVIDPLSVNQQGHDRGIQYRTGIYYTAESQLPVIRAVCGRVEAEVGKPLAVEIQPLASFFPAEEYHQKYLDKNPGGYCHIPRQLLALKGARGPAGGGITEAGGE